MASLADLAASNENIQTQLDEWRNERNAAGEDASDWEAFRQHVIAVGGEDPGEEKAEDF